LNNLAAYLCVAILGSVGLSIAAGAQEKNTLTIYTEQFPPYNYSEQDQIKGINVALTQAMCEQSDIACEFKLLPWNRAFRNALELDNSGLISTSRTNQREALFKWVGPLSSGKTCIYKLRARKDINIQNSTDLLNYKIGMASDNIYLSILNDLGFIEDKNLLVFPGKYGSLKPFKFGRVDLTIGSAMTIHKQLAHVDLSTNDIQALKIIESPELIGNFLALNKNTSTRVQEKLQSKLDEIKQNGKLAEIENQYLHQSKSDRPLEDSDDPLNVCL